MSSHKLIQQLQTYRPSAKEIKEGTGFSDTMVDDYLTMFENFVLLANSEDSVIVEIGELTVVVTNHIENDSAHGVDGENVGTKNYCSASTGGVVNLAALVANADLSEVDVIKSVNDAPVLYSQEQVQKIVDLVEELKDSVNQLTSDLNATTTQLNELITNSKTAKQMAS
ncbi:MAG: hypothetical protein GY886_00010 [Gammaproteobacteria bacterium]|nr:hypothetical protein [Gammaproteobacteria bacterium]